MPAGVRAAIVRSAPASPSHPISVLWLPADAARLPLGRISLRWEPASGAGWDVTAHLGLATTEVHLASWHAAPDDWPRLVHPTIREVTGLCSALAVATAALELSNHLAER
ncbi:esterase [Streptomyces acidiscabies]|uniref:Esterase n=1 Tax=Streptomyces acidiscabies TaxID=42234 RepID=A0A0L0KL56_9ACTN|nr:esterase [Streptomyces acidiscabies]KND38304.1 esterase [Streptomyces acidiscabies]